MTEKQKRNRARFKKVVAEAAKLRAKNPKLTQAEAVKKAWAMSYGTKKAVAGYEKTVSKGTKTTVHYTVKPKKKAAKKAAPKKLKQGALFGTGSHKDTRSHNVNIRVVSGLPTYKDPDMAREIELFADNDSLLYTQKRKPILQNLKKKLDKGTFDVNKAAKLWRYYIDAALQKYNKEFGTRGDKWYELMSVPDRNLLAIEYAKNTLAEWQVNSLEGY